MKVVLTDTRPLIPDNEDEEEDAQKREKRQENDGKEEEDDQERRVKSPGICEHFLLELFPDILARGHSSPRIFFPR